MAKAPTAAAHHHTLLGKNVPLLRDQDFDEKGSLKAFAAQGKPAVVLFFAPWCGHCITFAPVFADFASKMGKTVFVAAVDTQQEEALMKRMVDPFVFRVHGFPTVVGFYDGRYKTIFKGPRTAAALADFARSLASS